MAFSTIPTLGAPSLTKTTLRIVGRPFGSGILQAVDEFHISADGTEECTTQMKMPYQGWIKNLSPRLSAHPVYTQLPLIDIKCKQRGPLCDVTLLYRLNRGQSTGNTGSDPSDDSAALTPPTDGLKLPPDRYSETNSSISVPIEAAPYFADVSTADRLLIQQALTQTFTAPAVTGRALELYEFLLKGTTEFVVGSVAATETKYYWSRPPSIKNDVGRVVDGGNWLIISGAIDQQDAYWYRAITKLYSATPWPSVLYST